MDDLAIMGSGQNKQLERQIPVHSANRDSAKKAERARALNLALSFIGQKGYNFTRYVTDQYLLILLNIYTTYS